MECPLSEKSVWMERDFITVIIWTTENICQVKHGSSSQPSFHFKAPDYVLTISHLGLLHLNEL